MPLNSYITLFATFIKCGNTVVFNCFFFVIIFLLWNRQNHGSSGISDCIISPMYCCTPCHSHIFGDFHHRWDVVPFWLHPLQHREDFSSWYFCALSGIMYHLSRHVKIDLYLVQIYQKTCTNLNTLHTCCSFKRDTNSFYNFSMNGGIPAPSNPMSIL